ncbi:MAG: hypothetical protein WBE76_05515 [Terracidiphilus sp.]
MRIWERFEQHSIHKAENRRVGANAEREGKHRSSGETRVAAQGAEAVAEVSAQLVKESEADSLAVLFILNGGPAKVDAGFAARFVFGKALPD